MIEALTAALSGAKPMTSMDAPVVAPEEKVISAQAVGRRRRNTIAGSEGVVTAPLTPNAVKVEEPLSVGPLKRSTRRKK